MILCFLIYSINENTTTDYEYEKLSAAPYIRNYENQITTFGDIVLMARGQLEIDSDNNFILVERNNEGCMQDCNNEHIKTSSDNNNSNNMNISAYWIVERIRHKNEHKGHRYEFRITIYVMRRDRTDGKREITSYKTMRTKTFIMREEDYPKIFADTFDFHKNSQTKIQRRFFDITSLFNGKDDNREYDDRPVYYNRAPTQPGYLNIGEFYSPSLYYNNRAFNGYSGNDLYPSQPFIYDIRRPPIDNYHGGNHVRFPDEEIIIAKDQLVNPSGLGVDVPPVTATHLHHHYYLNKNKLPIVHATSIEKENIFDDERSPHRNTLENINHRTRGYLPKYNTDTKTQSPNIIPEQLPVPPSLEGNNYVVQTPYSYPVQVQLVTPPGRYFSTTQLHPDREDDSSEISYRRPKQKDPLSDSSQLPSQLFSPLVTNYQSLIPPTVKRPFRPSEQEKKKYSESDPMYHVDISTQPTESNENDHNDNIETNTEDHPKNHKNRIQYSETTTQLPQTDKPDFETSSPVYLGPEIYEQQYPRVVKTTKGIYKVHTFNQPVNQNPDDQIENFGEHPVTGNGNSNQENTEKPDSINAQLPPPERGVDVSVPYVESSIVTRKTLRPRLSVTPAISKEETKSTESSNVSTENNKSSTSKPTQNKFQKPRNRNYQRTTTEKPVLKWMPKRARYRTKSPNTSTSTTEQPTRSAEHITQSPSSTDKTQTEEIATKQSYSTSISVKYGKRLRKPKIFLPTIPPQENDDSFEMTKANLELLPSTVENMSIFKASEDENQTIPPVTAQRRRIARRRHFYVNQRE